MHVETTPAFKSDFDDEISGHSLNAGGTKAAQQAIAIDLLELQVCFELETRALSLSSLSVLLPGQVLELAAPVDAASVRLTTNGQLIAKGELVNVGGRLGVRITHQGLRS